MKPYDVKTRTYDLPIIIASACLAFVLVLCVFLSFVQANTERITQQNTSYIADAGKEMSLSLSTIFDNTLHDLSTVAHLESMVMGMAGFSQSELNAISALSPFDALEYVDADGVCHRPDETTVDVRDRVYYLNGMMGQTGIDVVFDSRVTKENMLIFYAPVRRGADGPVVGVLTGHFNESHVAAILSSDFFGEDSESMLIGPDGLVLASSEPDMMTGQNYVKWLERSGTLNTFDLDRFQGALANRETFAFTYRGAFGGGTGMITPVQGTDWMLVKTFPAAATQAMVDNANADGQRALLGIVAIFVAFAVVIMVVNALQRRHLNRDVQDKTYAYNAFLTLFKRMVLVNFEDMTYRYLDNTRPEDNTIPLAGKYKTLRHHITRLTTEEEREALDEDLSPQRVANMLKPGTDSVTFEYPLAHSRSYVCDSVYVWESISLVCIERMPDGRPRLMVVVSQDVSEKKAREESINQAMVDSYHAAMEANQAKTDFLSQMSHDIRTPMNAIIGMTTLARLHASEEKRVVDCLDKISVSSRHLLDLVNEVLDLSKIESGKMLLDDKPFDLGNLPQTMETMFRKQAEDKDILLTITASDDLSGTLVMGDETRLQQVMVNLLGNALKFSDPGDSVAFTISEVPSSINRRNRRLFRFVVADTGHGMSEEFMKEMFEPFAREHDSRIEEVEGTGLGLPIAKNIVTLMKGSIQVESAQGVGTTFTVLIAFQQPESLTHAAATVLENADATAPGTTDATKPGMDAGSMTVDAGPTMATPHGESGAGFAEDAGETTPDGLEAGRSHATDMDRATAADEAKRDVARLEKEDFGGMRVLLVEDSMLNREIAASLLETMNVCVNSAENGKEAIEMLEEAAPGTYEMVFMDIQMPVMNGYEALTAIRQHEREDLRTLPVVMLSANAFLEDMQRSKIAGANKHLAKPIDINQLAAALHQFRS